MFDKGMVEAMINWIRQQGGMVLLLGGTAVFAILLMLELSVGWRFAYPYNLAWIGVVALPAAGVAILYLQTLEDGEDDRHPEGRRE